jgi:L-threonylcarbamoyladenylate synthase
MSDAVDALDVPACAALLAAGELVAFPTETVYGLGARADDDAAVARIFVAKGRPADHPLIVHLGHAAAVTEFAAALTDDAQRLMAAFWPGPMTVIVPRRAGRGAAAAGGQGSIGLRMPDHPVALALVRAARRLGVPGVAAPSANRHGRVSPTTAAHVRLEFGAGLAVLDGGPCRVGIESAIVDCTRAQPALLRPGQIGRARIEQVLGRPLALPDRGSPRAPGTLASHYAPTAPLTLLDTAELCQRQRAGPAAAGPEALHAGAGALVGVYSRCVPAAGPGWLHREMPADPAAVAYELFAVLRDFDAAGASAIWVERPPPGPGWDGVLDRLQRAAA